MMFMGKTAEEWDEIRIVYEQVKPILDTPEGQRLLLLGQIRLAEQEIEESNEHLNSLKTQLKSL